MDLDLSNITLAQGAFFLVIVTALDVAAAMLLAAARGEFSLAYVAVWLQSHTLKRVFPIFALATLGHGVPQLDIPAIPAFWGMAVAGLVAYILETVKSIQDSFGGDNTPADADPQPQA